MVNAKHAQINLGQIRIKEIVFKIHVQIDKFMIPMDTVLIVLIIQERSQMELVALIHAVSKIFCWILDCAKHAQISLDRILIKETVSKIYVTWDKFMIQMETALIVMIMKEHSQTGLVVLIHAA